MRVQFPLTMNSLFTIDVPWIAWSIMSVSAIMIGVSKTGIPGVGILSVTLVALAVPTKHSTGLILPMLIFADLLAVAIYRRHAQWSHLVRLMPSAAVGVVIGFLLLDLVNDQQLRPIIGGIVLTMLVLGYLRNRNASKLEPPKHWLFPMTMGVLAGVTTMMANAAGPIMVIYLAAMRLPKEQFIGTAAWYFLLLNCFKVPFSASLDLINPQSIQMNLVLLPMIVLGALLGFFVLKRLPQKGFAAVVQILAAVGAISLLIPGGGAQAPTDASEM